MGGKGIEQEQRVKEGVAERGNETNGDDDGEKRAKQRLTKVRSMKRRDEFTVEKFKEMLTEWQQQK